MMIGQLLLHDQTKKTLQSTLDGNSHAVLLVAPKGAGKGAVALALGAAYLHQNSVEDLLKQPYFMRVQPINGSIGIDTVRELQRFVSLKTTGTEQIRRLAIVQDAQSMTTEAQNALLKLLEEPPADTVVIMTVDHQQHLLPTVTSRVQIVPILPPNKATTLEYFGKTYAEPDLERAYLISDGRVGLLHAILSNDTGHPLVRQIDEAKMLYGQKLFERLCRIDELSKQKDELAGLLIAMKRIAQTAMEQSVVRGQQTAAKQWHTRLRVIQQAEAATQKNANTKLLLTDLFLAL